MSLIDKAIAAITPLASPEDREIARQNARHIAEPGDWLSQVIDHHEAIEAAFGKAKAAAPGSARTAAAKELGTILTGHSIAEEVALYPQLADEGSLGGAAMAYNEQQLAKVQMAKLEKIDPMSQDWLDKLEHIEGAVLHHVYEEEGTWFPRLKQEALPHEQQHFAARYTEEFERYMGSSTSHGFSGASEALLAGSSADPERGMFPNTGPALHAEHSSATDRY